MRYQNTAILSWWNTWKLHSERKASELLQTLWPESYFQVAQHEGLAAGMTIINDAQNELVWCGYWWSRFGMHVVSDYKWLLEMQHQAACWSCYSCRMTSRNLSAWPDLVRQQPDNWRDHQSKSANASPGLPSKGISSFQTATHVTHHHNFLACETRWLKGTTFTEDTCVGTLGSHTRRCSVKHSHMCG